MHLLVFLLVCFFVVLGCCLFTKCGYNNNDNNNNNNNNNNNGNGYRKRRMGNHFAS